jgi:SAM-dependent methyltransferase
MRGKMIQAPGGREDYDERYYRDLYIKPAFTRLGLSKIYYLWIAYFCIKRAAGLKTGSRVLDFGCGIGNLVCALRKIGVDARGVDPSKAAGLYSRAPLFCRYGDTGRLPFEDGAFDLVYSHEVLEHLSPEVLWPSLREISRVSRGKTLHMICVKERGPFVSQEPTHQIIETESSWKGRFEDLGYKVRTGNPFYFFPFIPYLFARTLNVRAIGKGYFLLDERREGKR